MEMSIANHINHSFFELNPHTVYEHVYFKNNSFRAKGDGRKLECVMRNICLNWAWPKRVNKETIK